MKKARLEFRFDIEGEKEKLVDASRSGDAPKVRRLLSLGLLDIGPGSAWRRETPLGEAASKGHNEVIRILLDAGADPNVGEKGLGKGWTPLHLAVQGGHEATAKLLLDAGANPDEEDDYGSTPLHYAACYGHEKAVTVLLERGTEPEKVTFTCDVRKIPPLGRI